jgi:hypothetical protein
MSHSPAIGVVTIGHWHSMAVQMFESLRRVARGKLAIKDFPKGVLFDAVNFFGLVREEVLYRLLGRIPSNPPANVQNYGFASAAYAAADTPTIDGFASGDRYLALLLLSHFMEMLRNPHETTLHEMQIAEEAARFFEMLARAAVST